MKTYKEFLTEVFSKPYPFKITKEREVYEYGKMRDVVGFEAEFKTENGLLYRIYAVMIGTTKAQRDKKAEALKQKEIMLSWGKKPKLDKNKKNFHGGIWEVHFDYIKKSKRVPGDEENISDISGTGDSFRVFATILSFIKDFSKKVEPDFISIKSKNAEANRTELYKNLAKRYAKTIGYDVIKSVKGAEITRLELKRKNT